MDVREQRRRPDRGSHRRGRQPVPVRDGGPAARRASPHRTGHAAARAPRQRPGSALGAVRGRRQRRSRDRAQPLQGAARHAGRVRGDPPRPAARVPLPLGGVRRVRPRAHGHAREHRRPRARDRARRAAQRAALRRAARALPALQLAGGRLQAQRSRSRDRAGHLLAHLAHQRPRRGGRGAAREHGLRARPGRGARCALGRGDRDVPARRRGGRGVALERPARQLPGARAARAGARRLGDVATGRRRGPRPRAGRGAARAWRGPTASAARSTRPSRRRRRTCGATSRAPTACS